MSRIALPRGRQLAMTWGLTQRSGGMARAMLQRSRAFVRLAGTPVDVLTLDHRDDYGDIEQALRRDGELIDGMRLLNVWDWYRDQGRPAVDTVDDGGARIIELPAASGTTTRRLRPWAFYRRWLDDLVGDEPATLIVDSKTAARFAGSYRRRRVTVVHVVHNTHLGADGQLRASRRPVLEQLDRYDGVVLLSERQRRDVATLLGHRSRLAVVPNATAPARGSSAARGAGIVVGSLDNRKRVDLALTAAAQAGASIDVFGDGPLRERLQTAHPEAVFRGFGRLDEVYAGASFLLLTSKAEGFPLVLLEAMAAGCVPIAYDIRYGPADIITDGVDGSLVPDGDVDAMAAAIRRFTALAPAQQDRMRAAARRRAEAFSDESVTRRWARVLRRARRLHTMQWAARSLLRRR